MKRLILCMALLVMPFGGCSDPGDQAKPIQSKERISIEVIGVDKSESHFIIKYSLENKTDGDLFYMSPFTAHGRQVLFVYFVGEHGGETSCTQRSEQSTGMFRRAVLKPREKDEREINLMDGNWFVIGDGGNRKAKKFYLELNIPQEDGYGDEVWSGNAKSELTTSPVELKEIFPVIRHP